MNKTVFPARPDRKTLLQNLATLAMTGVLIAVVAWRREALARVNWIIPAAALLCVYVIDALLFTGVTVTAEQVIARAGHLSRRRIPLEQIRALAYQVELSPSGQKAVQVLALGEKRLFILLKDGSAVCVSPQDQQGFIALLQQRVPGLVIEREQAAGGEDASPAQHR